MDKKKLEARIAKLEKTLKNEEYDISADLYQWFNQYCCDVIDKDRDGGLDDLKYNLETADIDMFADEASSVLAAEYGWSEEAIEDYRYEIEYDIEKLIKDALDYIECGDTDFTYNINKADWMDRYRDNDTYTASLESRIRRLERKVKNENLDTANDMQLECARNVAFLADKMMRAAADIEDQAEASGDKQLHSYVYKVMRALGLVQFYLERKLR